jgi:outer membrane lipoprotein-sorting protein
MSKHNARIIFQCVVGIAVAVAGMVRPAPAQAQDGKALLMKVMQAYQGLSSYEGTASVTNLIVRQGKSAPVAAVTTVMKYKKPNKLHLAMTTSRGSKQVYSDGTTFSVFLPASSQYITEPTMPTLSAMGNLLATRAQVIGRLDPLFFLTYNKLPPNLSDFKVDGETNYEGQRVIMVRAVSRQEARTTKLPNGKTVTTPPAVLSWKWWIDKKTNLLRKVEARESNVSITVSRREGNKTVPQKVAVDMLIRHAILSCTANPALNDADFTFRPPAGATRFRSVDELLKGSN